jgi:hypothetical protein
LIEADYDVELTEVPGGHLEPITPGTESWSIYVDTVVATARGEERPDTTLVHETLFQDDG